MSNMMSQKMSVMMTEDNGRKLKDVSDGEF